MGFNTEEVCGLPNRYNSNNNNHMYVIIILSKLIKKIHKNVLHFK